MDGASFFLKVISSVFFFMGLIIGVEYGKEGVIRACSTSQKALKHKQKREKYGKIGARGTGDIRKKACIWDGGVNV